MEEDIKNVFKLKIEDTHNMETGILMVITEYRELYLEMNAGSKI